MQLAPTRRAHRVYGDDEIGCGSGSQENGKNCGDLQWGMEIRSIWAALGFASVREGYGRVGDIEMVTGWQRWQSPVARSAMGSSTLARGHPSGSLWCVSVAAHSIGGTQIVAWRAGVLRPARQQWNRIRRACELTVFSKSWRPDNGWKDGE